jgi:hypothetical protein
MTEPCSLWRSIDDRIERRDQRPVPQHRLLILKLGADIGQLRPGAVRLALGQRDVGLGHRLVAHRLLRCLQRDDIATGERLLAPVGLLPLDEHCARLPQIGRALGDVDIGDQQRRARLRNLGLLLAGRKARQHLPLGDAVAMVGMQFGERRADLEADLGENTRFGRSKTEDADRNIALNRRNRNIEWAIGIGKEARRDDGNRAGHRERICRCRLARVRHRRHSAARLPGDTKYGTLPPLLALALASSLRATTRR